MIDVLQRFFNPFAVIDDRLPAVDVRGGPEFLRNRLRRDAFTAKLVICVSEFFHQSFT